MSANKPAPVLNGTGPTDYARYMRTDELLALQKEPAEMAHRDELLFQTVHQTTELWLKHACFELSTAAELITGDDLEAAVLLVRRAGLGAELCTDGLRMLTCMSPADFQHVTGALGNGSGLESPGWRAVRAASKGLGNAFDARLAADGRPLVELYRSARPTDRIYQLAEALVSWDEAINVWRVRHYTIALRIRGARAFGTGGQPVAMLNSLIHRKFFPELWDVRDAIAGA